MPSPGTLYFTSLDGGMLCRDCEPAWTEKCGVPAAAWSWLCGRGGGDTGCGAAWRILDYHLAHLMQRALPLARMYLAATGR